MRAVVVGCVSLLVGLLVLAGFPQSSPAQTADTGKRFVVVFGGTKIPPGARALIEAAGGTLAPLRQRRPQAAAAVHWIQPAQEVSSTMTPKAIRYQAKGLKSWLEM